MEGLTNLTRSSQNVALVLKGARVLVPAFDTVINAVGFVTSALCGLDLLSVDGRWVA